ncbi:hypothetical protein K1719_007717 [Acacia pycnantha]|nr:hypothetical protein K1719_007717 [Acacia pycnantha]
MIFAKIKKKMGLLLLSLLLLNLFLLISPCKAAGRARFHRFKGHGSPNSELKPFHFGGNGLQGHEHQDVDEDEVFGADKRKVYTGPNPLHNR